MKEQSISFIIYRKTDSAAEADAEAERDKASNGVTEVPLPPIPK